MGIVTVPGDSADIYHYLGQLQADGIVRSFTGFEMQSERGAKMGLKRSLVGPTTLSGATTKIGGEDPIAAGWFVLGVLLYVTTTITGATSFKVGDGSDDDKWGATLALTAGTATTSANFTASPSVYTAATDIVATAVGGAASFSAGAVRAAIFYIDFTALLS